ncbi:MAG: DUF6171 family protein [Clostridium sp.]|nr:DUF6171 family protein [Clostridium sp.]
METQRICKRCLLREAFPKDYEKYVASLVGRLRPEEKADEAQYEERMGLCRQCEKLQNGTCMACGCLVEVRGMQRSGKCPWGRW